MRELSSTPLRCLVVWSPLILAVSWRPVCGQQPDLLTSEVVIPGTGRVLRLPHSLRPALHETHASLFHRMPRRGHDEAAASRMSPPPPPPQPIFSRHRRQDSTEVGGANRPSPPPPPQTPPSASDNKINDGGGGGAAGTGVEAAGGPADNAANLIPSNSTLNAEGGGERRGIADKEIVIIVVCASIGLIICLLGAALLGKFYWGKMREDGAGYQGVRQKDPSEGNSPVDDHRITTGSHKDKDGRVLSNMFAQIDEIDEESVPGSPVNKARRQSSLQPGGTVALPQENGETKPLLNYSAAAAAKLSSNGAVDAKIEVRDGSSCNDGNGKDPSALVASADVIERPASAGGVREVQVEVLKAETAPSTASLLANRPREPEARLYCRTGLSQSDYSISSFTSVNPSYHYGNQVGYMGGYYGYPCESGLISPDYYDDSALLLADDSLNGGSMDGVSMVVLLPPPSGTATASSIASAGNAPESPVPEPAEGLEPGLVPDMPNAAELDITDAPSPLPETVESGDDVANDDNDDLAPSDSNQIKNGVTEVPNNHNSHRVSPSPLPEVPGQCQPSDSDATEMPPPPPPPEETTTAGTAVTSSEVGDVTTIASGDENGAPVAIV